MEQKANSNCEWQAWENGVAWTEIEKWGGRIGFWQEGTENFTCRGGGTS